MGNLKFWIKNRFLRKPGFWFFQITGWLLMLLFDYFQSFEEIINNRAPYIWVLSIFTGFCISLLLRKCYNHFYSRKKSIYLFVLLIIGFSILSGLLWYMASLTIFRPLRLFIVEGAEYHLDLLTFYKTILRIFDYTWVFLIWSTLYFGLKFWIDLVDEKERSEKASLLAQKSQLQMLRYQLNPHFLFNSLNSIQALIYDEPTHADRMITELSEFLRFTLREKDKLFIPLGEEVKIVQKYLSMEKTRFPDRLEYTINVTDSASRFEVIAFLLQPFVENAVKHGMKTSPEKLTIKVDGYSEANRLYMEIKNSGHWIENETRSGTGIQNVFDRLQNAYPDKYRLHIYKNIDSVCVIIEIDL